MNHGRLSVTDDIKKIFRKNVHGLDFILSLRPVTYNLEVNKLAAHLKEDEHIDHKGTKIYVQPDAITQQSRDQKEHIQYSGFIAQEVETAANDIGYDFNGVVKPDSKDDLYGLQYAQFVVPMVKAIQEQHLLIESQNQTIQTLLLQNNQLLNEFEMLKSQMKMVMEKQSIPTPENN